MDVLLNNENAVHVILRISKIIKLVEKNIGSDFIAKYVHIFLYVLQGIFK